MIRRIAALLALIAVSLGAFGAHGLDTVLTGEAKEWWETATFYLLVHAVAALLLDGFGARRAAICAMAGSGLFAATLYAMALGAPTFLGMITPIGGVLMLAGWAMVAFGRFHTK
ncbi:DUF423 domain-containing protein [Parvularcula sp. LCG005]|uniref:DUF423 domain-containing protein n=1 Tax=Parvularcula sp. LCG005 TaxID=3078805 RepID=UPI0029431E88|nr:DUF423 domain-containing protein [Parvularcula sp. LCG005]WOI53805.1 DUF423 domain-containing protein [Parvularcula sp. LCG005]